jgi:hypothetical protein
MSSNNQSSNTGNTGGGAKGTNPMSKGDASRIQSTQVSFSTAIHWFPSWPHADVLFLRTRAAATCRLVALRLAPRVLATVTPTLAGSRAARLRSRCRWMHTLGETLGGRARTSIKGGLRSAFKSSNWQDIGRPDEKQYECIHISVRRARSVLAPPSCHKMFGFSLLNMAVSRSFVSRVSPMSGSWRNQRLARSYSEEMRE